jgi:hypothetical protein
VKTSVETSGTFVSTSCPQGTWPYTEEAVYQIATYQPAPTLLPEPLVFSWSLNGVPLTGRSGTAEISAQTSYLTPLPGGISLVQTVQVGYSIDQNGILQLTNNPADGNFALSLGLTATDSAGNVFRDTQPFLVLFTGNAVVFSQEYYQQQGICFMILLNNLRHHRFANMPEPMLPAGPGGDPSPDAIAGLVQAVAVSGGSQVDEILAGIQQVYGSSFDRAVFSQLSVEIAQRKG